MIGRAFQDTAGGGGDAKQCQTLIQALMPEHTQALPDLGRQGLADGCYGIGQFLTPLCFHDPLADQPEIEQMEIGDHRPNGLFRHSRLLVLRKALFAPCAPARISSERFIRRSPPQLFTAAALTGLRPAPESRSRRALPRNSRSFTLRSWFMSNSFRCSAAHSRR